MLRLDVEVSWDLLHLLTDEWQKVNALHFQLRDKYQSPVEFFTFQRIITNLSKAGLVETKHACGVRRSTQPIITLKDILKAHKVTIRRPSARGHGANICKRLLDMIDRVEFMNNRILHKRFKNDF